MDKALVNPMVMVKPCGVVNVGIMLPTVIATIFGVLGYWSFGTMEENVLRSLPFDDEFSAILFCSLLKVLKMSHQSVLSVKDKEQNNLSKFNSKFSNNLPECKIRDYL